MIKHFIQSCLTSDPSQRPSAKELLAHPWIQYNVREGAQEEQKQLLLSLTDLQRVD